jgi:hypothetical protein
MPQGLKEGQDRLSFRERCKKILTTFAVGTGGIEAALLMDDDGALESYCAESSKTLMESIGNVTAENMTTLENNLKSHGIEKQVQEMESVIEERRVFTLKISTKYALCVICPIENGARAATIKGKFHNSVKDEIISTLREEKLIE